MFFQSLYVRQSPVTHAFVPLLRRISLISLFCQHSFISSSLNKSLKPETLSGEHMWSCPESCSELRESTRETSVSSCGQVLLIQLNRFTKFNGDTFKDTRFVECLPVKDHILTVPLKLDDNVYFSKEFSLVAQKMAKQNVNIKNMW